MRSLVYYFITYVLSDYVLLPLVNYYSITRANEAILRLELILTGLLHLMRFKCVIFISRYVNHIKVVGL